MWCGFEKPSSIIAATCLITASVAISSTTFAVLARNYTPQEFRSVLRGLGYNVEVKNGPLTDEATRKAIREFQKGYKLGVDGIAGPKTQNFAGSIVTILQANLNAVLKPNPPLPHNQFYSARTEELIKEYQKKNQLQETGIANLALRQQLNQEAKQVITQPGTKPSPRPTATPSPMATPTMTPSPMATPTMTPSPMATPTMTPSPMATPTMTPSPMATPTMTPSPMATPTMTPSPMATPTMTPSPMATPTMTPSPMMTPTPTATPTP